MREIDKKVSGKTVSRTDIARIASHLRTEGKRIVFTNGCFDLLHVGHVRYLREARRLGDVLVLGLNSDSSVRQLKGPDRPVVPEMERAEILTALACVDYVVLFDETRPDELIKVVRPDIHVKGGDYTVDQLPEAATVQSLGGEVVIIPIVPGKSTSGLIQQLAGKGPGDPKSDSLPTAPLRVIGAIPARYHSTRLEGKPLVDICGKPMIQWVYEQVTKASSIHEVYVATDDQRIHDAVTGFGGQAVMTSPDHPSGTDRIAEAVRDLDCDVVVNLQGDEPMINPRAIDKVVQPLIEDREVAMSTLAAPLRSEYNWQDPNLVKVVTDKHGFALYFSRATIPFHRDGTQSGLYAYHHMGLYAYRKEFLLQMASLSPTPLEQLERLEQLRVLEHGHRIKVVLDDYAAVGVDTVEDLEHVRRLMERGG